MGGDPAELAAGLGVRGAADLGHHRRAGRAEGEAAGGKPPRRVPRLLARMVMSPGALAMMTEIRGASNAKARRELGWRPAFPTWREGFQAL